MPVTSFVTWYTSVSIQVNNYLPHCLICGLPGAKCTILLDLTLTYVLLRMYLGINGSSGFNIVILLLLLLGEYKLYCVFMEAGAP